MMKKLILICILAVALTGCTQSSEDLCMQNDGQWIGEANECEGVSEEACNEMGGEFEECASACRHMDDVDFCTQQCVRVCSFG